MSKMSNQRMWVFDPKLAAANKLTDRIKDSVTAFFIPLLEEYREQIKNKIPDKSLPFVTEVYTRWRQTYFYFARVSKVEFEPRTKDKIDVTYARLEFRDINSFKISYRRYTGEWHEFDDDFSLEAALEFLRTEEWLQPGI